MIKVNFRQCRRREKILNVERELCEAYSFHVFGEIAQMDFDRMIAVEEESQSVRIDRFIKLYGYHPLKRYPGRVAINP